MREHRAEEDRCTLSANVGETPAPHSITVGRWKGISDVRKEEDHGLGRAPRAWGQGAERRGPEHGGEGCANPYGTSLTRRATRQNWLSWGDAQSDDDALGGTFAR